MNGDFLTPIFYRFFHGSGPVRPDFLTGPDSPESGPAGPGPDPDPDRTSGPVRPDRKNADPAHS